MRTGRGHGSADGARRVQQFGMPNMFYLTALPTDPDIGWQESLFWWVPIDDLRHMQFSLHRVPAQGDVAERLHARRQARLAGPSRDWLEWEGPAAAACRDWHWEVVQR